MLMQLRMCALVNKKPPSESMIRLDRGYDDYRNSRVSSSGCGVCAINSKWSSQWTKIGGKVFSTNNNQLSHSLMQLGYF